LPIQKHQMTDFTKKFKLIYLPFLLITISSILGYTFLHWLLFIQLELFSIKEDILKFWLPIGLVCLSIYFFLYPRVKLLRFKKDDIPSFICFLAALIIIIPTITAQEYLTTATGKVTDLKDIYQIQKLEKTKYYTLKRCYIDKRNIGVLNTTSLSGKGNTTFNIEIYVTLPIFRTAKDTSKTECEYWLGQKYTHSISNSLSSDDKKYYRNEFAQTVSQEFKYTDFSDFTYLEAIGETKDHDNFDDAVTKNTQYDFKKPIIFKAHKERFEKRNGDKLEWFFILLSGGLFISLIFLLFAKLKTGAVYDFKNRGKARNKSLKEAFDILLPKEDYYITPILVNINIIVFLIMVISGLGFMQFEGKDLLLWGANFKPSTINGQWWRLLTATFLHGGIIHLASNMFGLLFIGALLEPVLGKTKFLLLYLLTGLLASLASIWWFDATVSVGASGAIFGLYGVFLALLLKEVFPKEFSTVFMTSTLIFIAYNLLMGLTGGIDNAAHIGGLLSGFIIGLVLSPIVKKKSEFDNK
jgi:rhomboid protease GluP